MTAYKNAICNMSVLKKMDRWNDTKDIGDTDQFEFVYLIFVVACESYEKFTFTTDLKEKKLINITIILNAKFTAIKTIDIHQIMHTKMNPNANDSPEFVRRQLNSSGMHMFYYICSSIWNLDARRNSSTVSSKLHRATETKRRRKNCLKPLHSFNKSLVSLTCKGTICSDRHTHRRTNLLLHQSQISERNEINTKMQIQKKKYFHKI